MAGSIDFSLWIAGSIDFSLAGGNKGNDNRLKSVLRVILYVSHTRIASAICTAEEPLTGFHSVPYDLTSAMIADRRESMDRAFEAVECVSLVCGDNFERQVIVVAAHFTFCHWFCPQPDSGPRFQ